jgi:type II secretory pathway pseudopilin PulG
MTLIKRSNSGFTLVEALCSAAILSVTILVIPKLNTQIFRQSLQIDKSQQEHIVNSVVDLLLADFKTANYQSLLNVMPTPPGAVTQIPWFAKYSYDGDTRKTLWIQYQYDSTAATLRRYQTSVSPPTVNASTGTLILSSVVPSFSLDASNNNIINFSLSYNPLRRGATVVKRRAAVRG